MVSDPTNRIAPIELEALTGAAVTPAISTRETILRVLDRAFPSNETALGRVRDAEVAQTGDWTGTDPIGVMQMHVFLAAALSEDATEIHFGPSDSEVRVRNRVNGQLVEHARLPRGVSGPALFWLQTIADSAARAYRDGSAERQNRSR